MAWKMSKEKAEVEDIVSESVVKLVSRVATLRTLNSKQLSVYISKTVWTTAVNMRKGQQFYEYLEEERALLDTVASPVEEKIEIEEKLRFVLSEIYKLPPKEQQVLRLKYSTDMNDKEIARIVGLSESSVRKYLSRGRARLKDAIYGKRDEP